ncbi:UvrD-helicase domain-containing protein [Pseudoclavibacter sp. VKM Ac-2888]|uniref:UvrD-helicase domain-containing protein n=1 Tax=Pseudoclavibacter sp. VKM Ac-2888 TaxID=2783830 RepID=UPI00188BE153|nr:UvrD-helicase domain-containing protein [Pseudoclavibacter sp. VKM Ac-2888]MBF4549380.1 ATP-dependent helicase [Pseudoclavibacter sp. VKM Ac-2888]
MSARTPTPEQAAIIAAAATGQNLTIEAGAGTGKTATLTFIADATQHRRSLYLAYNRAIATDAAQKFAGTRVVAKTMHALAFPSHGAPRKERMNTGPRMMPWAQRSKIYGTDDAMTVRLVDGADKPSRTLSREQLTKLVTETLNKFLNSGVTQIIEVTPALPAWADLIVTEDRAFLEAHLHTCTIAAWEDLVWNDGKLPFTHDTYLKQWALSSPQLPYDTIFLDEAQDSNPVIIQALKAQQNTQIVAVGDREQAIYGWRGASMSMDAFGGQILQLTTSFRFGETIATEANWWLDGLDASLRLTGLPGKSGQIGRMSGTPDGILARSNGGSLRAIMTQQERGKKVHVAGQNQAKTLLELATACEQLQDRGKTNHRDLSSFASWSEVQNLVESGELRELEPLVKIVDQYTARTVIKAIESCTANPDDADVTVSTAHVAKGLEWSRVRIHNDFYEPGHDDDGNPKPIRREEARLAYVAVTRAKDHLDATELGWAKDWQGGIESSSGPVVEVPRPIAAPPAPREVIALTPDAFVPAPAAAAVPNNAAPQASASQIVLQELIAQVVNAPVSAAAVPLSDAAAAVPETGLRAMAALWVQHELPTTIAKIAEVAARQRAQAPTRSAS